MVNNNIWTLFKEYSFGPDNLYLEKDGFPKREAALLSLNGSIN
jgi:hypothetical protein